MELLRGVANIDREERTAEAYVLPRDRLYCSLIKSLQTLVAEFEARSHCRPGEWKPYLR